MTSFAELGVPTSLTDVLAGAGIVTPTPIQAATLPDALAGRDVLGRGRTGSGKTLAFLLPIVARLSSGRRARAGLPRALVLAPTRELAGQIDSALRPLARAAGLTSVTVFGGVGQQPQVAALRRGVDILVACPGRLEDLITQRHCSLDRIEITVLDEADHMADLGFLPAVRRLLNRTPDGGQRMLFSATLDNAVNTLVRAYLTNPAVHESDPAQSSVATMIHHLLHIEREDRVAVLVDLAGASDRTVVFTRTKYGAKALSRQLNRSGVAAGELHGNLSQGARERNLADFHAGRVRTLVATDIAARGIHVDDVTLVVHADPPGDHKAYLHRSGRTARAGNSGTVVTLMTSDQMRDVRALTKAAGIAATTTKVSGSNGSATAAIAGSGQAPPADVPDRTPRTRRPHAAGNNTGRGRRTRHPRRSSTAGHGTRSR